MSPAHPRRGGMFPLPRSVQPMGWGDGGYTPALKLAAAAAAGGGSHPQAEERAAKATGGGDTPPGFAPNAAAAWGTDLMAKNTRNYLLANVALACFGASERSELHC